MYVTRDASAYPGVDPEGVCPYILNAFEAGWPKKHRSRRWVMLGHQTAMATVAVKDLEKAKKFYEGTLGLSSVHTEGAEAVTYGSGSSQLLVYRSQYAGTNKATAVTWDVGGEIEEIARALKAKGVAFEHYDLPELVRKGDVHVGGSMKAAWFKDPDGNIHALIGR
jgi:catechol 2,3-dioxygenase-like lactoylglutathione lyase family enzyme